MRVKGLLRRGEGRGACGFGSAFESGEPGFEIGLSTSEASIDEFGQEMGDGGDCLRRPQSSSKPAEAITECGFGGLTGLGGESQCQGGR